MKNEAICRVFASRVLDDDLKISDVPARFRKDVETLVNAEKQEEATPEN